MPEKHSYNVLFNEDSPVLNEQCGLLPNSLDCILRHLNEAFTKLHTDAIGFP